MSLISSIIQKGDLEKRLLASGNYEYRDVERNIGGIYYEVCGIPFYFGGEIKVVKELFPKNPFWLEFESLMRKPTRIEESLIKKAMTSIGLK